MYRRRRQTPQAGLSAWETKEPARAGCQVAIPRLGVGGRERENSLRKFCEADFEEEIDETRRAPLGRDT